MAVMAVVHENPRCMSGKMGTMGESRGSSTARWSTNHDFCALNCSARSRCHAGPAWPPAMLQRHLPPCTPQGALTFAVHFHYRSHFFTTMTPLLPSNYCPHPPTHH